MIAAYCRDVPAAKLAVYLCEHTGLYTYQILWQAGDIQFTWYAPASDWAVWEQGVLFGKEGQMRWRRRRGGKFHLVFIGEKPPADFTQVGELYKVRDEEVYLWGEQIFDEAGKPLHSWREGRLPQEFQGTRGYPVDATDKVRVALVREILEINPPDEIMTGEGSVIFPWRLERYIKVIAK